jgi:phosphoenolpyruvate-protein phosphotransferase (PTS system enzyme I)
MPNTESTERVLIGIGASPGICIGKAYLVDTEGVNIVKQYRLEPQEVKNEVRRFKTAVKAARDELRALLEDSSGDQRTQEMILETHEVLLKDKMLYGRTIEAIENEFVNAEWALKQVSANVRSLFQDMADTYLKDRAFDIAQVSERIMRHLTGANHINISEITKRVILVAHDLSPAETSQIQLERIKGFVTDVGGRTSHTSIIARSLGIPAVMGIQNASFSIRNNDFLIVDGTNGVLVVNPTEKTLFDYEERRSRYEEYKSTIRREGQKPATTLDGHTVKIFGNIELPEEVVQVRDHGGEGIGLYRTEFQYLKRDGFPSEEELFDHYMDVVDVMGESPVTIRTLDVNGDKAISGTNLLETNPALGLRAVRYCLRRPDVFRTQLRAILMAGAKGTVRILFPLISGYDELLEAKKALADAMVSLETEGYRVRRDLKVGAMIEVPSAVILADLLAQEVDFFSIGTNDLIQYAIAIDRDNRDVAYLYQPLHPAVLRMLKRTADIAKDHGIENYMCGEMAGDPICIPILLGLGLDELSMTPQSIPTIKQLIRSLSVSETKQLLADALKEKTARAVLDLTQEAFGKTLSSVVYQNGGVPQEADPDEPNDSVPPVPADRAGTLRL